MVTKRFLVMLITYCNPLCRDKASMLHPRELAAFWDSKHLDMLQSWGPDARGSGRLGTQPWFCCLEGARLSMSQSPKGSLCPSQQD